MPNQNRDGVSAAGPFLSQLLVPHLADGLIPQLLVTPELAFNGADDFSHGAFNSCQFGSGDIGRTSDNRRGPHNTRANHRAGSCLAYRP